MYIMKSPVLFIIFKREDTTKRVFKRIREAQPPRLYIAADGPRKDRLDEVEKCMAAREVVENVDWPCEVHRLYRDENLGCGKGVSSAITWFFEHEEQGIIIEDDVLADVDFFLYCDEMLDKYCNEERIQLISGRNAFYKGRMSPYSYYMSSLFHIWGWATWRRVWSSYVFDSSKIPAELFYKEISKRVLPDNTVLFWKDVFNRMQTNPIDTWDYQLYFNEIICGRYSIIPYVNMTENIGFDSMDATHTKGKKNKEINHHAQSPFPICHPNDFFYDINADRLFAYNFGFVKLSFCERIISSIRRILGLSRLMFLFVLWCLY